MRVILAATIRVENQPLAYAWQKLPALSWVPLPEMPWASGPTGTTTWRVLRRDYGDWITTYADPKPGRYHSDLKAGQLSQGDHSPPDAAFARRARRL